MSMRVLGMILGVMMLYCANAGAADTWVTLDVPGASVTEIHSIDGSNLVGWYHDASGDHGFLYDGTNWTTFNKPGASGTIINGINGDNLVGSADGHGFLYNTTTPNWTTLDMPGAQHTYIHGIDGSNLVGWYHDTSGDHGFLYDGASWTTLDNPGGWYTYIYDIDGSNLVGGNFLYNMTTQSWTTLDMPGAAGNTFIQSVNGNNLVGWYQGSTFNGHGFLYDGTNWTRLDVPGARQTFVYGIDGSNLVGCYESDSGGLHGFLYTIPEPATISFLLFSLPVFRVFSRKNCRKSVN